MEGWGNSTGVLVGVVEESGVLMIGAATPFALPFVVDAPKRGLPTERARKRSTR